MGRKVNMDVRNKFLGWLNSLDADTVSRQDIVDFCIKESIPYPQWYTNDEDNRAGRGMYKTGKKTESKPVKVETQDAVPALTSAQVVPIRKIDSVVTSIETQNLIPEVYKNYVPFGNYDDLSKIISSGKFYPVFITGHSGNGKTMMVEQICAKLKRRFICLSMTPDTDEGDMLGNYVLIDGEMVWRDGPVTVAAKTGSLLCIDEIDYGSQNLSTLQRILEGKPFLLKKKNEVIVPADGFNIVVTANTKGKGSEDGRYMFTNVLNEAFLERFPITMEQEWAPKSVEIKILQKELNSLGCPDDEYVEKLISWAITIRKTFEDDGTDEVISTRRLVHIIKAYSIFGDRIKAIQYCLNRFDADTKSSFIDLYTKIDSGVEVANTVTQTEETVPNEL